MACDKRAVGVRGTIVLAIVVLWAASAWALDPAGGQFRVNTYTMDNQINPAVAGLTGGGFVVVWESFGQDEDGFGVFGQIFDSAAKIDGDEFMVNTETEGDQHEVSVAGLSDGNFVVSWTTDLSESDSGRGILAQIFDDGGDPQVDDIAVNEYTTGNQDFARVASLPDGFVVVWTSANQDGNGTGIFARLYDNDGGSAGHEFQVNSSTKGDQRTANVHGLSGGGFVVTWVSDPGTGPDTNGAAVFAQIYNGGGTKKGSEFQLNTITTGDQVRAVIAPLNDGGFVSAWESRSLPGEDPKTDGIAVRRFSSSGVASGTEVLVNTYTTGHQEDATIAAIPGGEMIVAWESPGGDTTNASKPDTSDDGVFARGLDAAGKPSGTKEFQVNTYTTNEQDDPAAALLSDGSFVVVWESTGGDGSLDGISGQRFNAVVCGDASKDGKLTSRDALQILKASVSAAQACQKCRCDVNGDGAVNTTDALAVLQASVSQGALVGCNNC